MSDIQRKDVILYRSCKVVCHEISHLFGLRHCAYYQCILLKLFIGAMNGSNHIEEDESKPLEICHICLRKLEFSAKILIKERYEQLL